MIKAKDLKEYAKLKGIAIEETYPCTGVRYYNNKPCQGGTFNGYEIGIEFQKDVYYWFDLSYVSIEDLNNDIELFFSHRYNRNNGAVQKSFSKGFNAKCEIEEYLLNNKENDKITKIND